MEEDLRINQSLIGKSVDQSLNHSPETLSILQLSWIFSNRKSLRTELLSTISSATSQLWSIIVRFTLSKGLKNSFMLFYWSMRICQVTRRSCFKCMNPFWTSCWTCCWTRRRARVRTLGSSPSRYSQTSSFSTSMMTPSTMSEGMLKSVKTLTPIMSRSPLSSSTKC